MILSTWYDASVALAERWARNRGDRDGLGFIARRGHRWSWLASLSVTLGRGKLGPAERAPQVFDAQGPRSISPIDRVPRRSVDAAPPR